MFSKKLHIVRKFEKVVTDSKIFFSKFLLHNVTKIYIWKHLPSFKYKNANITALIEMTRSRVGTKQSK